MLVAGRGAVVYEEEGWVVSRGAGELLAAGARPRAVRGPNSPADAGPRGAAARVRVSARRGALWALPLPLCPTVSLCILLLFQGGGRGRGGGPGRRSVKTPTCVSASTGTVSWPLAAARTVPNMSRAATPATFKRVPKDWWLAPHAGGTEG